MPLTDEWKKDLQIEWSGKSLIIQRPPIGVILGSKLAACREKDLADVQYLVHITPNWKEELAKYTQLFSKEDREEIENNIIYVNLFLKTRPPEENPSILNPTIPQHKKR